MVYLIHLDEPFKHARHYLGFTTFSNPKYRLEHHKAGTGSRMLAAVNKAGIDYSIVRVWENGTRELERSLKNKKNSKCLCPICKTKKL